MDPIENIALESAAGSGKTRALTRQFLRLFLDDADYRLKTLYGITFTNEATLEMKKRILRYLDLLATGNARDESDQGILDDFRRLFPDLEHRAARKKRYLLNNLSDLNISTFHSLFASFLSSIPFAAGILPDYEIIDEGREKILFEQVLDRFLETVHEEDRLLRAVLELTAGEETPIKTILTDTYRNALPWFEFLTDLTRHKDEIDRAVETLRVEFIDRLKTLKTFIETNEDAGRTKTTGTMNRHLAGYIARIGNYLETPDLEIIAPVLKVNALLFKNPNSDEIPRYIQDFNKNLGPRNADFTRTAQSLYQCQKRYLTELSNQKIVTHLFPILEIARRFQKEKQQRNFLSFADIEGYAHEALKENIETNYLYFKIGADIDHLLIDEFQDTSYLQLEILAPIITEITAVRPAEKSIFYVGDPRQAIFRWRGGSAELFTLLPRRHEGKIKKDILSKNYRSKQEIVDFVNTVIGSTDQARPDNTGGWIRMENIGAFPDKDAAEAATIALTVALAKKLHAEFGYHYSDIAVLVRRNAFGTSIARELARNAIPCLSKSRADILSSDDVRLIIQLLKFLDNPENDFALLHLLTSPVFRMKEEIIRHLKNRGKTLYLALTNSHPDWHATKKLRRLLDLVYFSNPYELLYRIYQELELLISYPLATLLDAAADYLKQGFSSLSARSLSAFVDWLETAGPAIDIKETHPEGVEVLTVHKAKGLEFEVVILAETFYDSKQGENPKLLFSYAQNQVKPDSIYWRQFGKFNTDLMEAEKKRLEKDELNLLYVAMTRAKSGLYILGCTETKKEETKPVGFWYGWISEKVGSQEYAAGEITKKPIPEEERAEKTYGAIVKNGALAEIEPIVKDELPLQRERAEISLPWEQNVQEDFAERKIFTPTEREVEIIEPARRKGMEFGDLVHRALAQVEFLDDTQPVTSKPPSNAKVLDTIKNLKGDDLIVAKVVAFMKDQYGRIPEDLVVIDEQLRPLLLETLSDPDLRFIFHQDSKDRTCKNELALYFEDDKRDVSIHIDRLIVEPKKIIIIDYKTGTEKPEYKQQMRVYKKGVECVYPGKPVEAILIYLEAERGKKIVKT
jgi:exodeoxyribonuclease V beta subunit